MDFREVNAKVSIASSSQVIFCRCCYCYHYRNRLRQCRLQHRAACKIKDEDDGDGDGDDDATFLRALFSVFQKYFCSLKRHG